MSTRRKLPTIYRARLPIAVGIGPAALDARVLRAVGEFERMFGRPPTRIRYPGTGGWHSRIATVAGQNAIKPREDDELRDGMIVLEAPRRARK